MKNPSLKVHIFGFLASVFFPVHNRVDASKMEENGFAVILLSNTTAENRLEGRRTYFAAVEGYQTYILPLEIHASARVCRFY